jgi:polyhydroxyalkanoate synthesis regulator phasin
MRSMTDSSGWKFVLRSDLQELKARVETLQGQIKALEERLGA